MRNSLARFVGLVLVAGCQTVAAPHASPAGNASAVPVAAPSGVSVPTAAEAPPTTTNSAATSVPPTAASAASTVYVGPIGHHAVDVRKATALVVHDTWDGMGQAHAAVIALQRSGIAFTYVAKVSTMHSGIGAPVLDPYVVLADAMPSCACPVQQTCSCEHDRKATRRQGRIEAAPVDELLAALAARPLDTKQDYVDGRLWTDDYPFAHLSVSVPSAPMVHFSAIDQQRHWRRNGKFLAQDREELGRGGGIGEGAHRKLNAAVRKLLDALGVPGWVSALHKANPGGGL